MTVQYASALLAIVSMSVHLFVMLCENNTNKYHELFTDG